MKKLITLVVSVLLSALFCMTVFAEEPANENNGKEDDHVEYGIPEYNPTQIHESQEDYENGRVVVEPTCTGVGFYRFDCTQPSESGVLFHEVVIPALGHDWGPYVITKDPTCTETGIETRTCKRCGVTESRKLNALGHLWSSTVDGENWGRVTKEPTCTSEGEAEDFCTRCGEINTFVLPRILEKKDHIWVTVVDEVKKATCISDGHQTSHVECAVCHTVQEDSTVTETWEWTDPGEFADDRNETHDWDGFIVEIAPTCAEEGLKIHWCKRCGAKQEVVMPVLEADYRLVKTRLVNCYEEEYTYRCANCDGTFHEDIIETGETVAHTFRLTEDYWMEDMSQPADCTHWGYDIYQCVHYNDLGNEETQAQHDELIEEKEFTFDDRGTIVTTMIPYYEGYRTVPIAPHGHDWNNWILRYDTGAGDNEYSYWIRYCDVCETYDELVASSDVAEIVDATCTEAGKYVFLDGSEEEIPAKGHEVVESEGYAATCTEDGMTAGSYCAVCGEVISEQEVIPATGHDYVAEVTKEATCTEDGETVYTCSACGDSYTEAIEATGHVVVEDEAVAATTTSTGLTAGSHCSVCGEVLVAQEVIPMLKDGLTLDADGTWRVYDEGEFAEECTDIVEYDDASFFVSNGVLCSTAYGLNLFEDEWYYLAAGRIVTEYTGITDYDGEFFYVVNGVLDQNANGLYEYNGGTFLVAAGRVLFSYNGLWQDADGEWWFLAGGQVQDVDTLVEYDGAWFYVKDGKLAVDFTGEVEYCGSTFNVIKGMVY